VPGSSPKTGCGATGPTNPIIRDKNARIYDPPPGGPAYPRKGIVGRLRRRSCEMCGAERVEVEVHQVRGLASLDLGTDAGKAMARMRRKTLVMCGPCHGLIDAGPVRVTSPPLESRTR
jgi:hypothetical protein